MLAQNQEVLHDASKLAFITRMIMLYDADEQSFLVLTNCIFFFFNFFVGFLTQEWPCFHGLHVVSPRRETESSANNGAGAPHPEGPHIQGAATELTFILKALLQGKTFFFLSQIGKR